MYKWGKRLLLYAAVLLSVHIGISFVITAWWFLNGVTFAVPIKISQIGTWFYVLLDVFIIVLLFRYGRVGEKPNWFIAIGALMIPFEVLMWWLLATGTRPLLPIWDCILWALVLLGGLLIKKSSKSSKGK